MSTIDLDYVQSWPRALQNQLPKLVPKIFAERAATLMREKSPTKWQTPSVPTPAEDFARELIAEHVGGRELLMFHATRMLDPRRVFDEGLRALVLADRIKELFDLSIGFPSAVRAAIQRVMRQPLDEHTIRSREGQVCFSNSRDAIHNGGSDELMGIWGGEALRRHWEQTPDDALISRHLGTIGSPTIVVAKVMVDHETAYFHSNSFVNSLAARLGLSEQRWGWDHHLIGDLTTHGVVDVASPEDPRLSWPASLASPPWT